jgi:hypothetical protein
MNDPTRRLLTTSRLRTSPAYELVVFNRLTDAEQATFAQLRRDPDCYGVLRPREGQERTFKAISCDSALLLLTLAEPGLLPDFATRDDASLDGIAAMIVGGLLELEHDGAFVGAEVAAALLSTPSRVRADHRLARLSHDALRFASSDPSLGSARIAAALYQFNRQPSSPRWERAIPDRDGVLRFVGLESGSPARRTMASTWDIDGKHGSQGWIYFTRRRAAASGAADGRGTTYKLYVSPTLAELPRTFAVTLGTASRMHVAQLKLGSDALGLLRPDKLVLYFPDLESLLGVAREIERALPDVVAHGVPFTAPIDDRGLLSWGIDPPSSAQTLTWQSRESWRTYLASRLAAAIAECRTSDVEANARFALDRLRRDGVDTDRWIAGATLWTAA